MKEKDPNNCDKKVLSYGSIKDFATGSRQGLFQTILSGSRFPSNNKRFPSTMHQQTSSETIMTSSHDASSLSQESEEGNEISGLPQTIQGNISDDTNSNDSDLHLPSSDSFLHSFFNARGAPQIMMVSILYALAVGSTAGVVPSVMTDQYAKVFHSFDGGSCADYSILEKPQACLDGNSNAQTAAAAAQFVSNSLTFLSSSVVGSLTDEHGRKYAMALAYFLNCLAPLCLVLAQIFPTMNPDWYYIADGASGLTSWVSIGLAALADVMPKKWRAPIFGLLFAAYSLGFALSPMLALGFSHLGVSILALLLLVIGLLCSLFVTPETLSKESAESARISRREHQRNNHETKVQFLMTGLARPLRDMSILNRSKLFRLLSLLAFFSGMSSSADQTLLVYYVENQLNFGDSDIALLFGIIGISGIFVQGALLKPFTEMIGERFVVVFAFVCGAITNTLYAFAPSKGLIIVAILVSSFGAMSFPTISAIKSNNVDEFEQGRIQGALYALSSLASAIGPASLRLVYQKTKNTEYPGSFFLTATVLYIAASFCAWELPKEKANSTSAALALDMHPSEDEESSMHEQEVPLL